MDRCIVILFLIGSALTARTPDGVTLVLHPNGAIVPEEPPEVLEARANHIREHLKLQLDDEELQLLENILFARATYISSQFNKLKLTPELQERLDELHNARQAYLQASETEERENSINNLVEAEHKYIEEYYVALNP